MDDSSSEQQSSADEKPEPTRRGPLHHLRRFVLTVLLTYIGCLLLLAFLQRKLIYRPLRVESVRIEASGLPKGTVWPLNVKTGDDLMLHGWQVLPEPIAEDDDVADAVKDARFVVLLFPGNARHRSYRRDTFRLLTELGMAVILVDYRGYAENEGSPNEAEIIADSKQIHRSVIERYGLRSEQIIVMGESLGGSVATQLAAHLCQSETPPAALVLQSTFSSLTDAGANLYPWLPVRWVLRDRYESVRHIVDVTCPILHYHGDRDTIVPLELGRRLFAAAADESTSGIPKRFVTLTDVGHNGVIPAGRPVIRQAFEQLLSQIEKGRDDG